MSLERQFVSASYNFNEIAASQRFERIQTFCLSILGPHRSLEPT